jgi:hypothetical protein
MLADDRKNRSALKTHTHTGIRKCAGQDKARHGRNRQYQIGFDENHQKCGDRGEKNSPKMLDTISDRSKMKFKEGHTNRSARRENEATTMESERRGDDGVDLYMAPRMARDGVVWRAGG